MELGVSCLKAAGTAGGSSASGSDGWEVRVRDGRAELVKSTTSRSLHITVYAAEGRTGSMASGDCSSRGIREAVATAIELSSVGDPDPWSQPAPLEESGMAEDPDVDDPAWSAFTPEQGIALVVAGDAAAHTIDQRINLSDFCGASSHRSSYQMASTTGIRVGGTSASSSFTITAIAQDGSERQMGSRGSRTHRWQYLRTPQVVGIEAGAKAVAKIGWKRSSSGPMPVVLDEDMASDFRSLLAHSVAGDAIFRRQSWCMDRHGTQLANPQVSVVDDPHLRCGSGSRQCDHDGVRSRRTVVLAQGRLEHYLVSGYAARRLGHPYTGHGAGVSNLILQPGTASQADLIRQAHDGLLITGFQGWGIDLTAGTFSREASGFRIEQGHITHPVQELTLAGRLADLWAGVRMIGNDPKSESAISSPSLLIDGFTVGGSPSR